MRKKLSRHRNGIVIFTILILLVDLINPSGITEFYNQAVVIIVTLGLIFGVFISVILWFKLESKMFYSFIDTISVIWIFFFVFYTLISFVVFPARVNGTSMVPNFENGDVIVVWKLNSDYKLGDVVFVNVTEERTSYYKDEYFLKRIIGVPGDRVEYVENQVYVNGELLVEEYDLNISDLYSKDYSFDELCRIKDEYCEDGIPEDYYFVLGDNRTNSTDSRKIGLVHKDDLFGKVIFDVSRLKLW